MATFSEEQYRAFLARQHDEELRNQANAVPEQAEEREADLHDKILDDCKARGWLALHGSMAHRTRRTIGEPDFILLLPGGVTMLLEVKSATGKMTTEQLAFKMMAEKLGHFVRVVRSFSEYQRMLKFYGVN